MLLQMLCRVLCNHGRSAGRHSSKLNVWTHKGRGVTCKAGSMHVCCVVLPVFASFVLGDQADELPPVSS